MIENLDKTDLKLLHWLQQDASLTNVELAAKVSLSPSPTLARVKKLESDQVISRYVALVDPHALGLKVNVFVRVSLEKQEAAALERFEKAVSHFDEVMEVYLMTGDEDYLLRIVVPDLQARLGFTNTHQVPRLAKIVINCGIGSQPDRKQAAEDAADDRRPLGLPVRTLSWQFGGQKGH